MKHSKLLEKVMRIQRKIEARNLPIKIGVGINHDNEPYLYINKKGNIGKCDKHFSNSVNRSDKEIIDMAIDFLKPKYTKLKKLCINSLNESVYIKKDDDYIKLDIVSITKNGLNLSDGNVYSQDKIYIKE